MSSDSRYIESEKPKRKSKKLLAVLLSCCLFLTIACASLLAALVLIGKHLVYNSSPRNVKVATEEPPPVDNHYRLPRDVVPIKYDIFLKPNLENGNFEGLVNITVNVTRSRKEIIVNGKNLSIDTVELVHFNDSKVFRIENVRENAMEGVLIINTKEIIRPGLYDLHFKYRGSMLNKLVGLYRSQRDDNITGTRYIATSKFEPTDARQAFPCFDEPNFKATYKVHLLKPSDPEYVALSNYPQNSEEQVSDGTLVHFGETVPMSTYLSCFIVSDFKFTETSFDNKGDTVPFRVYASPDQLDKTNYAGKVGKDCIEYYIKYFDIPYPLPKLDMVAIPDFVSGAMEHWGLVTYRETALLYNESTHSSLNKIRVAEVVSHELAHSWFGNLVTMNWWDNLWLNEGFASYIQYKGVNAAEPSWNMMDLFLIRTLHAVLTLDATQGSHPIITDVLTPSQINAVFDTISYNKGASVLRMLEYVVGPDNFKKGVTNYLNKYKYGNALTQYLWDELQAVVGSNLNVTEFMDTYTIQMGYPILSVKAEGNKYTFTQKRFLKDYDSIKEQKDSPLNYKWNIPLTYITDDGKQSQILWFNYKSSQMVIEMPANAKWIKFNPGHMGYYRVNYAENDWKRLIEHMIELPAIDRTHLIEESFAIASSGDLSYQIPLEMTKYLKEEDEYMVWAAVSTEVKRLMKFLRNSLYRADFEKYIVDLLIPAYTKYGWNDTEDGEDLKAKLLREVILELACYLEYEDALEEATLRFQDWLANETVVITPNLRTIIYKYGMMNADRATWDTMFKIFTDETDANEKLKLLQGLASVRNPSLLTRLIELGNDETYVRGQDYFTLLTYISQNPVGTPIVWDHLRENWQKLQDRFGLTNRYLGRIIPDATTTFSTEIRLDEMQRFFAKHPEAGAGASSRKQAVENIQNNIKWLNKYKTTVEDWIKKNAINVGV